MAVQEFPRGLIALACVAVARGRGLVRHPAARARLRVAGLAVGVLGLGAAILLLRRATGCSRRCWSSAALVLGGACARAAFGVRAHLPQAPAPQRPVLFFNPKSGGGKAERFSVADEARARGIEPIELGPPWDLERLVRDAVAGGADGLAMAGGDGSQAIVAAIAAELDLPYACVPAGTRNHFALDLGVDRDDVVGALDAFVDGGERRVDLAEVNGRVFVNNVSLGLYADAVQREGYRDAKLRTLLDTVPDVLGPDGDRARPALDGPGGHEHRSGAAILVSNNRYRLGRAVGSGTRPRIDDGLLGITVGAPDRPRQRPAPAAAAVARVDRAGVRGRCRPPGARRHRRRGGHARAAAALPHPPRRPARARSRAGILAPRRRRMLPEGFGRVARWPDRRRRDRLRPPTPSQLPTNQTRRRDGHLRGRAEGTPRAARRSPRGCATSPTCSRATTTSSSSAAGCASPCTVPDEVDLKIELEVESDERELEIELTW